MAWLGSELMAWLGSELMAWLGSELRVWADLDGLSAGLSSGRGLGWAELYTDLGWAWPWFGSGLCSGLDWAWSFMGAQCSGLGWARLGAGLSQNRL